jgi:hypothetical protein
VVVEAGQTSCSPKGPVTGFPFRKALLTFSMCQWSFVHWPAVMLSSSTVNSINGASVGVLVGVIVGVGVFVGVAVGVGVLIGVAVGVGVLVGVAVGGGVPVGIAVGVGVLVGVAVSGGVPVGVAAGVDVLVAMAIGGSEGLGVTGGGVGLGVITRIARPTRRLTAITALAASTSHAAGEGPALAAGGLRGGAGGAPGNRPRLCLVTAAPTRSPMASRMCSA